MLVEVLVGLGWEEQRGELLAACRLLRQGEQTTMRPKSPLEVYKPEECKRVALELLPEAQA